MIKAIITQKLVQNKYELARILLWFFFLSFFIQIFVNKRDWDPSEVGIFSNEENFLTILRVG